jgi:hypothetical protein
MPHQTNELDTAKERLLQELSDGLKHGFFEYTLICEVVHGRKRQLIIKAGKSYKFTINEDDLR